MTVARKVMSSIDPSLDAIRSQFLEHLIDAAAMRADIENLKRADSDMNVRVLTALGEIAADMKSLREGMTAVPQQIAACRTDMRDEVERDFPSKPEAMAMEQRIEKQMAQVDKTLGTQIAEVDKKLTAGMTEMSTEISKIDTKVEKMWIKITVVVTAVTTTIMAIGGFVQWLMVLSKIPGG